MHVEPHHPAAELAARIRSETRAKVGRRLTAVRLALLGHRPEDIAPHVFLSARQVRTWITRYNAGGPDGLADATGRGRKPPLDDDARTRMADRLRAGPTAADGVCTPRGEDVRLILTNEFGLVRSSSAVYHLLHALGFEPLRPRPRHPKGSAEAQQAFQKSSPAGSPRSRRPTPGSGSRSGPRTRPGSARSGR